jgi:UDP-glucose 4-epimerase
VEFAPRRPGDPDRLVASAKRAKSVLGWVPKHSNLRSIVESAWAWHQAHPNGYVKATGKSPARKKKNVRK